MSTFPSLCDIPLSLHKYLDLYIHKVEEIAQQQQTIWKDENSSAFHFQSWQLYGPTFWNMRKKKRVVIGKQWLLCYLSHTHSSSGHMAQWL